MYNEFQMKEISNLIINEKDSKTVFIFPSEAAALYRRREFLKITGKRAVRNDRFLSWDSFKEQITLHNREDKPVNSVLRRLFAADIVRRNSKDEPFFRRLIPMEYSKNAAAFTDTVYRVLPELQRLVKIIDQGCSSLGALLEADYRKLYDEYRGFLSTNSLFEPSWEFPDIQIFKKHYFIICPELIEDFEEYSDVLKNAGCRFFKGKKTDSGRLRLFENSVIETDAVLNEISTLLHGGMHYSDIAVTCADNQGAEQLLSKARLRGIPLNYRSGKTLGEYPAGRLAELIRACRTSGYSISSMKNLLLYRAFIWKESETAAGLVRFGIENRCLKNTSPGKSGDVWALRLKAAGENRLLGFYNKLKSRIESVCRSRSFNKLAGEMQVFISSFLQTGPELWEAASEQVFQRTREVLSSLRDIEQRIENLTAADPLSLWIELLNEKIYVRQQEEPGIPVYPYRVSALINPEVHFVTGLSRDASTVISAAFGFLTDQQRSEIGADELNMSDDFISSYAVSGVDVRFSCASETKNGVALPPGAFIESGAIDTLKYTPGSMLPIFSDPVIMENLWWESVCRNAGTAAASAGFPPLTAVSKEGFSYAAVTFMNSSGFDASTEPFPADYTESRLLKAMNDENGYLRVSASALNRWSECPFNQLLAGVLAVSEDEYILKTEDPMTAGTIMHEILFGFFSRLREEHRAFRAAGRLEEYRAGITEAAGTVFSRWKNGGNYFFGPAWEALRRRALEDLLRFPEAEAKLYDGLSPAGLELWLDFVMEDEKIRVGGFIDRISNGEEGAVIIDYKKTWSKQTRAKFISFDENGTLLPPVIGYQLPLYIMLSEAAGMRVAGSSYYSISGAEHFPVSGAAGVLSDDDVGILCELTLESIRKMAGAVRSGDFRAPVRCDGCGLRAVCRKRFNLRWEN